MRRKRNTMNPLVGILFIIIGIVLLWWNEGNNVKNIKTIDEARSLLVNVAADKVDSANEGKLVSTNGKLEVEEEFLLDSTFNLKSPKTAKLERVVEMLQWVEVENEDDDGYVTYSYKKQWLTHIEDSSSFNDSRKENPSTMPYESEEFYASNVTLGAFTISDKQKEMLSTNGSVHLDDTVSIPSGYFKAGNYIANVSDLSKADIGTVRISFIYNNDKEISVLGKQSGNTFVNYTSKQGKSLFRVESGILTGEDIINVAEKENNLFKWVFRFMGVIFTMAGFAALLGPLAMLFKWIPLLGNGIAGLISSIGALIGLAVSLVVIAIAWIFYRPLLGILLLAGVVLIGFLISMLVKKTKAKANGVQSMQQPVQQPVQPMQQPVQPVQQAAQQSDQQNIQQ